MGKIQQRLIRDGLIFLSSVLLAVLLFYSGWLDYFFTQAKGWGIISSLLAGMGFVSVFTTAPAAALLLELAKFNSPGFIALGAALGAVLGDYIIFHYARRSLKEDFGYLSEVDWLKRLIIWFRRPAFKWLLPILGALVIASPLPDELGLILLGVSSVSTKPFLLLSFVLNFLGIYFLILVVR